MNPEQFITAYGMALAGQQWKNIAPLIHENACVTFSTGSVHRGIDAIQQAYERNFSIIKNEQYAMTDVQWLMQNEEVAVYVFVVSWTGIINGEPAQGAGRGTAIITSQNGEWKLLAEHLGKV